MKSPRLILLIIAVIVTQNGAQAIDLDCKKLVKTADLNQLKTLSTKPDSEIKKINLKGNVHALFIDYDFDLEQHSHSELVYKMQAEDGNFYTLYFQDEPRNITKINEATIEGYIFDNEIAVEKLIPSSNFKTKLNGSTVSEAKGNQRTLVIPIYDPIADGVGYIYTPLAIQELYFSTSKPSLQTYYNEVSKNLISFSGTVTSLYTFPDACSGGNLFGSSAIVSIINTVETAYDLSKYDRLSFVLPDNSSCIDDALGIASFGKVRYTNPLGKQFIFSYNINTAWGAQEGNATKFLKVIAHEFGHNIGLTHDNANACGKNLFTQNCSSLEYGGVHSMMGQSPNLAHINSIQQEDLEWLSSRQIQTIDESSFEDELKVVPLASNDFTSLKSVKIRRQDGSYYVVEFRQPINSESQSFMLNTLNYNGIQIYLNNDNLFNNSILFRSDFKEFNPSNTSSLDIFSTGTFAIGQEFYDPVSEIRIIPTSITSQSASFKVIKGTKTTTDDEPDDEDPVETEDGFEDGALFGYTIQPSQIELFSNQAGSFFIQKTAVNSSSLAAVVEKVEWDLNNDGVIDVTSTNINSGSVKFLDSGNYRIIAKVYLKNKTKFKVELDTEIKEFFDFSLIDKKSSTSGEKVLNYKKKTLYYLNLEFMDNSIYDQQIKAVVSNSLSAVVKTGNKFVSPKGNTNSIRLPITFAREEAFIIRSIKADSNGYYKIPIQIQVRSIGSTTPLIFTYDLELKSSL